MRCVSFVTQVTSYLTKKFAALHSPNKFKVYMGHGGKPWVSDFNHPHYMAGRRALKTGEASPGDAGKGPEESPQGGAPCRLPPGEPRCRPRATPGVRTPVAG